MCSDVENHHACQSFTARYPVWGGSLTRLQGGGIVLPSKLKSSGEKSGRQPKLLGGSGMSPCLEGALCRSRNKDQTQTPEEPRPSHFQLKYKGLSQGLDSLSHLVGPPAVGPAVPPMTWPRLMTFLTSPHLSPIKSITFPSSTAKPP